MTTHTHTGRRISSGLFEVDLGSGDVLRQGRKAPLQEQPFRVLSLLLERPGQVVTREELQSRVWPADTYVSFDEGLNTAIRKLRVLFGDSADNPRFIETVPRRGYRFIAPVTELTENERKAPEQKLAAHTDVDSAALELQDATAVQNDVPRAQVAQEQTEGTSGWRRWRVGIAVGVGIALLLLVVHVFLQSRSNLRQVPAKRAMLVTLPFRT